MLDINTRKVLFSLVGVAIVSFIAQIGIAFFVISGGVNISPYTNSWTESILAIVVTALGILLGLVIEKFGRNRYFARAKNNPAMAGRMKQVYRIVLIIGIIGGSTYILLNLWAVYAAFSLGLAITITSAQRTGTIIEIGRYIALALAMLWLFAQPQKTTTPPTLNIKKLLLWTAIYCFIMATLNLFGLSMYRIVNAVTPPSQPSTAATSSTPPVENPVGTMPATPGVWTTYTFPNNFSVQYPSTWSIVSTSSDYLNISSSPTVGTFNGVCKIYASVDSNALGASWEDWYASDQGQTNLATTSVTLSGLPALLLTDNGTDEPYIKTVVDNEVHALLPNGSIADITMYCGSNVISEGEPIYQTLLQTFKVL